MDDEQSVVSAEDARLATEIRIREDELALKREEVNAQIEHLKYSKHSRISPLLLAIVAAGAGIIGSLAGAITQYIAEERQFELEHKKFQFSILEKAITAEDVEQASENLRFFLDARILEDPHGTLRRSLDESQSELTLPIPGLQLPEN